MPPRKISGGQIFVFEYGVVTFWDISSDNIRNFLHEIEIYLTNPHSQIVSDDFDFSVTDAEMRIHNDHIYLSSDDLQQKLAVSHALAQSVKLHEFENYVQQTIEESLHIPRNIEQTGKSHLSRRQIAKKRGSLYIAISEINLRYDLLDVPDLFWEYPELEKFYSATANYLEISQRLGILNKKLAVIHDILTMLADEQNHKHSALLEWIIIWLIAIEVFFFFFHDIFKIF